MVLFLLVVLLFSSLLVGERSWPESSARFRRFETANNYFSPLQTSSTFPRSTVSPAWRGEGGKQEGNKRSRLENEQSFSRRDLWDWKEEFSLPSPRGTSNRTTYIFQLKLASISLSETVITGLHSILRSSISAYPPTLPFSKLLGREPRSFFLSFLFFLFLPPPERSNNPPWFRGTEEKRCTHTHTHTHTERERERQRERGVRFFHETANQPDCVYTSSRRRR